MFQTAIPENHCRAKREAIPAAKSTDVCDRGAHVRALFRFLNASGLRYCVLGDTRDYPDRIRGDVDIAVPVTDLAAMPRLLLRFCRARRLQLVQILGREPAAMYMVLASTDADGPPRFLAIDLCSDYRRHGSLVLAAEALLGRSKPVLDAVGRRKAFPVPLPAVQFIYYLVKKIDKLRLDCRQGDYLSACWQHDAAGCEAQLRRFWPDDATLISRAAASGDWSPLQSALPELRTKLRRCLTVPFRYRPREWVRKTTRIVRPDGLTVAVSGTDARGGSSVIDQVLKDMAPAFRGTSHVTRAPVAGVRKSIRRTADVGRTRLFFDDVPGYFLTMRQRKARSTLVIFDRHYDDLAAGPQRYRNDPFAMLARSIEKLMPKPDLRILLDAAAGPAELHSARVIAVDASRGIEHTIHNIDCAILAYLVRRMEWRHPALFAAETSVGGKTAPVP